MKKVNMAVIGAGGISQNFHLPILYLHPNVNVVALYDKVKSKSSMVAEKYDIPNAKMSLQDILEDESIDCIDICTSTDAHHDTAIAAIEAGKDVFIEKPVARNYKEACSIKAAANKHNVNVMIGNNQRFRHDAIVMKNSVKLDEVGKVFYVKAGWLQQKQGTHWREVHEKSGGGVLMDLGLPMIDSLLWIYEFEPVKSVRATTFNNLTESVEDVAIANIRFENGSLASLEASWSLFSSKRDFYCTVYGSKGSVRINPLQIFRASGDIYEPVDVHKKMSNIAMHKKSFESELKHFVNVVQGLAPVMSTIDEACQTMQIIEAMYKSAAENSEIQID